MVAFDPSGKLIFLLSLLFIIFMYISNLVNFLNFLVCYLIIKILRKFSIIILISNTIFTGSILAIASNDGSIKMYEVQNGKVWYNS